MPDAGRRAMLRSVLIGLDGTEEGDAARDLGLAWAARAEARAWGLAIVDEARLLEAEAADLADEQAPEISDGGTHAAGLRRRIKEALRAFDRGCSDVGVRGRGREEIGEPAARLLAWSRRTDLVVVGRRHREGRPGVTLEAVLRGCPRPVVAVPAKMATGAVSVVAYDGSEQASRAVYAFVASGLGAWGPVHVVAVASPDGDASELAATAVAYLESHDLDAHPCPVNTERGPAEVLLERSRRLGAGLIIMGAYGQSLVREFFLGSVTRTLLAEADAPILCDH